MSRGQVRLYPLRNDNRGIDIMDALRQHARQLLANNLSKDATHSMVVNAETSIFNYCTRRCRSQGLPLVIIKGTKEARYLNWMYKQRVMSITFNLRNPRNPQLLHSVLNKDVECRHLGFFTREQLFPELWKAIRDKLNDRDRVVEDTTSQPTQGGISCSKCKGKGNVHISIVQTRSADEGSTLFCYCATCSKRWKIYT